MHHGGLHEDDIAGKAYDRRLMGRFLGYLRPHLRSILSVLLLLPPIAGAKLLQPYIDNHIVTGNMNGLPGLALLFLLLIFGESLLTYAELYLLQRVGQQVMFRFREELFTHLQKLSLSFFDRTPAGGLVTRLTSDVEVLGEMFAAGIIEFIACALQMNDGFIHPNLNLMNPLDTRFHFAGATARPLEAKLALSNGFGFGGFNSSLVLGKVEP